MVWSELTSNYFVADKLSEERIIIIIIIIIIILQDMLAIS